MQTFLDYIDETPRHRQDLKVVSRIFRTFFQATATSVRFCSASHSGRMFMYRFIDH